MNKKVKLGLEILLTIVILAMVYKLATNETKQDQITNAAVQNMNNTELQEAAKAAANDLISKTTAGSKTAPKPALTPIKKSPQDRGDFDSLNE